VHKSEVTQSGVIVDFDADGQVLGVEILQFAQRFQLQNESSKPTTTTRGKILRKSA